MFLQMNSLFIKSIIYKSFGVKYDESRGFLFLAKNSILITEWRIILIKNHLSSARNQGNQKTDFCEECHQTVLVAELIN